MVSLWTLAVLGGIGVGALMLRRYMYGAVFKENVDMTGKTVVITGSNCGIGQATAQELCKLGAQVILACRNQTQAEKAAKEIKSQCKSAQVIVMHLDLASLQSIRDFVTRLSTMGQKVDVLINNAGVFQCPFQVTEDGFEMQMGVNYLGHFLLTNLMKEAMKDLSRVVIVSSGLAQRGVIDPDNLNPTVETYSKASGYYNSKLACNYFARELSRRVEGSGLRVYCVGPGMVRSNLGRHINVPLLVKILVAPLWWILVKNNYYGCQTLVYCAAASSVQHSSGGFFRQCAPSSYPEKEFNEDLERRLWEQSERLVKL